MLDKSQNKLWSDRLRSFPFREFGKGRSNQPVGRFTKVGVGWKLSGASNWGEDLSVSTGRRNMGRSKLKPVPSDVVPAPAGHEQ